MSLGCCCSFCAAHVCPRLCFIPAHAMLFAFLTRVHSLYVLNVPDVHEVVVERATRDQVPFPRPACSTLAPIHAVRQALVPVERGRGLSSSHSIA